MNITSFKPADVLKMTLSQKGFATFFKLFLFKVRVRPNNIAFVLHSVFASSCHGDKDERKALK